MPATKEVTQRVEIALAQSKKVEREARILKQMLGGLSSELLQPESAQGEPNANRNTPQDQ